MEPADLDAIFSELKQVYENLKAEVLIAEIQENSNLRSEDFVISNRSTFSRPRRRDIIKVDPLINDDKLTFELSRNGIYDLLPEGLFHVQKAHSSSLNYSSERKAIKQQEQDARKFFSPLENEFFHQRLQVERNERVLLDRFYNLSDKFLLEFWKIDLEIPKEFRVKLIKLLPYSYKIAGNFELTRLCLEKLLDEKVTFKRDFSTANEKESIKMNGTGSTNIQLGVDSILESDSSVIYNPVLEVTIGPIPEKEINKFLKIHGNLKFINTFYDYFVPVELDVVTKFTTTKEEGFLLEPTEGAVLGISTQL